MDTPIRVIITGATGILNLEKTNVSRLQAQGWKAPIPVNVKAYDGTTAIYGLVFTPTQMDPNKKYPVIDYIYPEPQGGSVGSWSFTASRGNHQALAELGSNQLRNQHHT
ncbi:alpha/beta hydrolase [Pedobacter polaris]|uniref:hypothetical protein n=1 Tax=Pedobacter polaris TaxID=2571273 RepID=UPI00197D96A6|nr:hypothetical protein [Pedobacter polaris]